MIWRYFGPKDRTSVEARQGYLDRPVLWVLIVSLLAVVVIFAILYAGYFG